MPAQQRFWQSHFHIPIVINKHEPRKSIINFIHVTMWQVSHTQQKYHISMRLSS